MSLLHANYECVYIMINIRALLSLSIMQFCFFEFKRAITWNGMNMTCVKLFCWENASYINVVSGWIVLCVWLKWQVLDGGRMLSVALFSLWSFGASYGVGLSLCRIIAQVVGKVSRFYFVLIQETTRIIQ